MKWAQIARVTVGAIAACHAICAQELEPRAYSNSPTGFNFVIAGFGFTTGSVLTDPSLPVENVSVESEFGVFAWATTLDVLDKSAKIDLVVPYGALSADGLVFGEPRRRSVTGFGDPAIRFSMNFIGAPALTVAEFADYRQEWIVGASIRAGLPLGQYDSGKLVNIGANRWSLKPEIGVSKALGPWTLELAPGVCFYTDNGDFFGGHRREQEPLYSAQGHLSYSFAPGFWLALNGGYFVGGRTTVDGETKDDRQEGTRFGLTLALPVTRHHSLKLYAVTGINARARHDFDAVGVAWQYRWGGGY